MFRNNEIPAWDDWVEGIHGTKNSEPLQSHDPWFYYETLLKEYQDLWNDWRVDQVYWFDRPMKFSFKSASLRSEIKRKVKTRYWMKNSWVGSLHQNYQNWNPANSSKWA